MWTLIPGPRLSISIMEIRHCILFLLFFSWACTPRAQPIDKIQLINDIKTLSSAKFSGRKPGTVGHEKAKTYIVDRFTELGLTAFTPGYLQQFPLNDSVNGYNIIGYIPGKQHEAVVISAHYDHLGERQGEVYLGADDNASGVAGLLALARYYSVHQPNHTLIFTAFDAEEMGLRGARYFVAHPPLALSTMMLNVNMDMISRNENHELYASGTYHYPYLLPLVKSENSHVRLRAGHDIPGSGPADWTTQSDHAAFHAKHIPFIYFGVEDHPGYHTPDDTFENIQPDFFYQSVRTILDVMEKIDRNPSLIKTRPMEREPVTP